MGHDHCHRHNRMCSHSCPDCSPSLPEPSPPIGDQEWCQPGDIRKRQFLVTFDDPDCRNAVFDDETEARRFWAKACLNWNCYLFGALPVDPAPQSNTTGHSTWAGWDQSRLPWSEAKHKDAVCYAAFGDTWSMEDAHTLISFIERTWPRSSNIGIPMSPEVGIPAALDTAAIARHIKEFEEFAAQIAPKLHWKVWQDLGSGRSLYAGGFDGWQHGFGLASFDPRPLAELIQEMKAALALAATATEPKP